MLVDDKLKLLLNDNGTPRVHLALHTEDMGPQPQPQTMNYSNNKVYKVT